MANAGAPSRDPLTIELTELGRQQAEKLALLFVEEPSLIVVSPAERARATALPTILRFPTVQVEEWPIQEFTYLAPTRCEGTTGEQRRAWVEDYWDRADPSRCDGDGAESFRTFLARVDGATERLSSLASSVGGPVLMFGHGQFINAMRWRLLSDQNDREMQSFRAFDLSQPIAHCKPILLFELASDVPMTAGVRRLPS